MVSAEEFGNVASSLPEANERETWGHPTFRVRDKMFAALSDDGRSAAVDPTELRELLVETRSLGPRDPPAGSW